MRVFAIENNQINRMISSILVTILIATTLLGYTGEAYADRVVLSDKVYYHLDMGVQLAYSGPDWHGYAYGDQR